MPRKLLTPRVVDSDDPRRGCPCAAGKTQTVYLDDHPNAPRGFALRVRSSGAKTFILRRALRGGGRTWIVVGPAKGAGLDEARRAARLLDGVIADGKSPNVLAREKRAQERQEAARKAFEADEWTVLEMARAYVASRASSIGLDTYKEYERQVDADVEKAPLGAMRARHVVRDDVRRWLAPIAARAAGAAWQVLALVRSSYRWAMDEETVVSDDAGRELRRPRVDRDPTRRIEREFPAVWAVARRKRKRFLSDEEIAAFWLGLERKGFPLQMRVFARLVLLCGTRLSETHKATWENIDLKAARWHIPAAHRKGRMEGSAGERRAIDVPLSPLAVTVLETLKGRAGRLFTFSAGRVTVRIKETGVKCSTHDVRRTCSSGLQRIGAPPHVISVVLGHAREAGATATDGAYTHDPRVNEHAYWLAKWADHVAALTGGGK